MRSSPLNSQNKNLLLAKKPANLKVLSRYVKLNALLAIIAAIIGLWALQLLFSYLSELDSLNDSYTMSEALKYIFYRSPYFLEDFIPTGALLGAVVGLGLLANNSELVVMRAAGVSVYRIVGWVLQPALLFVILALAINQFILPTSNQLANAIDSDNDDNSSLVTTVRGYWTMQPSFISDSQAANAKQADSVPANSELANLEANGSDILYIDYADVDGNIGEVKRWHLDKNGNLQSAIRAEGGRYTGRQILEQTSDNSDEKYRYDWQLNNVTKLMISQGFNISQNTASSDTLS